MKRYKCLAFFHNDLFVTNVVISLRTIGTVLGYRYLVFDYLFVRLKLNPVCQIDASSLCQPLARDEFSRSVHDILCRRFKL
jgi:hypothetical protein